MFRNVIAVVLVAASLAPAVASNNWQARALALVKQERVVIDARWRMPETNVLWVAVLPDGSDRSGLAKYLCLVLSDAGAPSDNLKTIFIHAPATFETGGSALGVAACR